MKEVLDYNVLPKHYSLKIVVKEEFFEGEEEIVLDVQKNTKRFNFNIFKMEINDIRLRVEKKVLMPKVEINQEVVTLFFTEELKAGIQCVLSLKYKGEYSEDMQGFSKSFYNGDSLYSTKFEPTYARRAFPCWDQPDMKATFDIALKPLEGFGALSNSSLREIKDGFYYFNTTPKMSTYIVAFISGKLESIEATTKRNVPIAVYAHKDEKEWGRYALDVAVECLDFFEDYFRIDYPLPKLDLVSIPAFVSGAMENWGLVTFRKTSLLFKEGSSSSRSKKLISETVCHELAHMWFGNLVTMTWWNDLWLNEGFATWAASLALSHLSKSLVDWEVWTEFINSDIEAGMLYDCLDNSHPIAVNVNKPCEISQIFDSISYSKGASMIRMLEGYIGREEFKAGIRSYLRKFKYRNATTQDLWDSFRKELNVGELMNDWINKKGFPLVSVKEENEHLVLTQSQFLLSGKTSSEIWQIPLIIFWLGQKQETILMKEKTIKIKKQSNVYKLNSGAFGFYRVVYENTSSVNQILDKGCSVNDRLNIVNDICALCESKRIKIDEVVLFSKFFKTEMNCEILTSLFLTFNRVKSLWYENKRIINYIDSTIKELIGKRVDNVNIFDIKESVNTTTTNSLLVFQALRLNNQQVVERLSKAWDNREHVDPELMRSVLISVVDNKYEEIFALSKKSPLPEEKLIALSSLAFISNSNTLSDVMNRYSEIEPNNSIYFFIWLSNNVKNRELIINFICDNFDSIRSYMKNDRLFSHVVDKVLSTASTKSLATKVINLLNSRKNGELVMTINKAMEKIENNLKFKEFNSSILEKY